MDVPALRTLLAAVLPELAAHEDELRALDAALGDGDLGITVRAGSRAVADAVAALPEDAALDAVLRAAGQAFATANPSTFAALVGGGLLAASRAVPDATVVDRPTAAVIARAVADRIADRGGAALGDKTVLDALLPTVDLLESADDADPGLARRLHALAADRVAATAELTSARGRAAWVGDRSAGHPDPGAAAYTLLLGALADHLESGVHA